MCVCVCLCHIRLFATLWLTRLHCPWDFQTRILEWVAISFCRGPSHPGIKLRSPALQAVFCISGGFSTDQASKETPNLPSATWRPRKGNGFVSVQPLALRIRGLSGVRSSLSLKVLEQEGWMSKGREWKNVSA